MGLLRIIEMGGGGVMRAVAKVAGFGIFITSLRGGGQVTPPSAEHSVMRAITRRSASSGMTVSSGGFSPVAETTASGGKEPMARVLFGGVPSLEETKEATTDLKDALDKLYLSSPKSSDSAAQASVLSLLSNPEENKDCVPSYVKATSVSEPAAIKAFRLLHRPEVQSAVESIVVDPNVWNAVLNNSAFMELKHQGSARSSESSVKLEDYLDGSKPKDSGNPFSGVLKNIKTSAVEMVNKAMDFLQGLFALPFAEKGKENGGSNIFEKTTGASIMGLVMMVIMIVLLKRV